MSQLSKLQEDEEVSSTATSSVRNFDFIRNYIGLFQELKLLNIKMIGTKKNLFQNALEDPIELL